MLERENITVRFLLLVAMVSSALAKIIPLTCGTTTSDCPVADPIIILIRGKHAIFIVENFISFDIVLLHATLT